MSKIQPSGDIEAGFGAVAPAAVGIPLPPGAEKGVKADGGGRTPAAKRKVVAEEQEPRLGWAFVRKVYCIIALHLVLTAGFAAAACYVRAVPHFLHHFPTAVLVVVFFSPFVVIVPLSLYKWQHPRNLVLLGLFTLCTCLSVAVAAAVPALGVLVTQAAILLVIAVIGLILFTFWAAKRDCDFTFIPPILSASLLTLLVYITIQTFFPMGEVHVTAGGLLATLVYTVFIVCDTHRLLNRHTYNEYMIAAISLYLDMTSLFILFFIDTV